MINLPLVLGTDRSPLQTGMQVTGNGPHGIPAALVLAAGLAQSPPRLYAPGRAHALASGRETAVALADYDR